MTLYITIDAFNGKLLSTGPKVTFSEEFVQFERLNILLRGCVIHVDVRSGQIFTQLTDSIYYIENTGGFNAKEHFSLVF